MSVTCDLVFLSDQKVFSSAKLISRVERELHFIIKGGLALIEIMSRGLLGAVVAVGVTSVVAVRRGGSKRGRQVQKEDKGVGGEDITARRTGTCFLFRGRGAEGGKALS